MYAIVDIAGKQMKVEKNREYYVNRLRGEEGAEVVFGNVLLIEDEGKVKVGQPTINGAVVKGIITAHLKADKVLIFKKKRRKGYQTLNGHRQPLSRVKIEEITVG
ncbi:MAG: 50S ribosomal protein L21 [Bacteroidales bacterium]